MSLTSPLKALALAAAMLVGLLATARAEIPTTDFESSPPVHTDVRSSMAQTGHLRPYAGDMPRGIRLDAVIRNEDEFDRAFGACRRC
jgi:hypothetical protein